MFDSLLGGLFGPPPARRDPAPRPLAGSVGPRGDNLPDDLLGFAGLLEGAGYLDRDPEVGHADHYTERLHQATRKFQKDNGLKVDGLARPGGETFRALSRRTEGTASAAEPAPGPQASTPTSRAPVPLPTRLPRAGGPVDGETFAANGRQADALLRTALDGDLPALYVTSFRDGGRRAVDQYADFLDQLGHRDGARARAFHRAVLDLTPADLRRALFGEGAVSARSVQASAVKADPVGAIGNHILPRHPSGQADPRPNLLQTTAAETPETRPTSRAGEGRDLAREPDQRESGNRPADSVPKVGPDTPADTDEEELVQRGRHFMKPAVAELYDDLQAHAKSDTPLAPAKVDALHRRTQELFPGDAKGAEPYHRHIEYLRDGEGITDHELDYLGSVGSEVQRVQREIYAVAMAGAVGRGRGRKGRPGNPSRKASEDGNRKRSASDDDIALPSKSVTVNPYTVDEFRALPQSGTLDPKRIRTMQNSVNDEFRDGRRLVDTIKELKSGETKTIHIEPIRIGEIDGQVFTLDHRRVVAHRLAGIPIRYRKATPVEIKRAQKGWKNRKKRKNDDK